MPDSGLTDEIAKKAKSQSSAFKLYCIAQVCNKTKKRILMKSYLKMYGRKYVSSTTILVYEYANDRRTKYASIADWQIAKRQNADTRMVQTNANHPSDSLQCDVIRKVRENFGIKLTRKKDAFLMKKAQVIPINQKKNNKKKQSNGICSKQRIILMLMLPKDKD
ncbi:hypothetical protein RFI_03024 [Reticulomyxa filosa]|uniref:Uncharacterized protein n=1 Tax=Reticulomyxa filosa TaxID=46433 RepID=X6P6B9_RETFI|nr:hypothetical protein RFI_03024 [Reticulomyxa filosa]|eukprot:ETO34070.1 hypothetical protein RFI_03024 [Reticulomyxa filosa]